jgi:DNA-binding MarR family transcriptional regulator
LSSRLPDTSARGRPEHLAILLREPYLAMNDLLLERLGREGHPDLRPAHGAVFEFLDDAGSRVSVLARRAQITKQSMAELVAHLERHGYVERIPDPGDGRAKLVRSTARGREVYAVARALAAEIEARMARELGERRLAELRAMLQQVRAAL